MSWSIKTAGKFTDVAETIQDEATASGNTDPQYNDAVSFLAKHINAMATSTVNGTYYDGVGVEAFGHQGGPFTIKIELLKIAVSKAADCQIGKDDGSGKGMTAATVAAPEA